MKNLDYGIIGNCSTAALISKTGSLDWLCFPYFDSPSMFASILDDSIGGSFSLEALNIINIDQRYLKNTNILITSFITKDGSFDLLDFMPRYKYDEGGYHCPPDVIRYIKVRSGNPVVNFRYQPSFNYGASKTSTEIIGNYVKSFSTDGQY